MTREPCKYCGQEERYGHNALCVMNTVEELRAEVERLKEQLAALQASSGYEDSIAQLEIERLRDALKAIECHSIVPVACQMPLRSD